MDRSPSQFAHLLHQPLRLALAVHLAHRDSSTLAAFRAALDDDDHAPDVLASPQLVRAHAALLRRAGIIDSTIGPRGGAIVRLTDAGREALAAHRRALLAFIPIPNTETIAPLSNTK